MVAAAKDESIVGGPISGGSSTHGPGLVWGIYDFTKADASDWVNFTDFESVKFVIATNDSAGALDPCTIDGTTEYKVTFSTGTGATTALVIGTKAVED
jgi:hypothetical protein